MTNRLRICHPAIADVTSILASEVTPPEWGDNLNGNMSSYSSRSHSRTLFATGMTIPHPSGKTVTPVAEDYRIDRSNNNLAYKITFPRQIFLIKIEVSGA